MTVVDNPRLLPAPAPAPAAVVAPPSAPGRAARRREGRRRSWSAWLVLALVVGASGYGGYRLLEHRLTESTELQLDRVALVADPVAVGSPDAAVVASVAVAPGQAVRQGDELAVLQLAVGGGLAQSVPLTAPVDGNVVAIAAQPGSVVRAGESVVSLYDPQTLAFHTDLPVGDVEDLAIGMSASISGPGLGEPVEAVVDRVLPVIDAGAGVGTTMTVVLVPVDESAVEHLIPGVPLTGSLDTASGDGGSVLDAGA